MVPPTQAETPVQLLVCTTCRVAGDAPAGEAEAPRAGRLLHDRLRDAGVPEGVEVLAVDCLSNCSRGCTVALRGPGRWTYVYGNLDPDAHAGLLAEGAAAYRAAADGIVPWRARPEHFRKNCVVRLPPLESTNA